MRKPISGTQAAKLIGLGNNLSFVRKFVWTNQILPIVFPGAKRKLYDPDDVERLIYLNKQPAQVSNLQEKVNQIINKHRQAS
jgi:hypothetical protein